MHSILFTLLLIAQVVSPAQVRQAVAEGRNDDAWTLMDRLPADAATVSLAVELALAPRTPTVAAARLPFLADRTARLSIDSKAPFHRTLACAVVIRLTSDAVCAEEVAAVAKAGRGTPEEWVRLWVLQRALGRTPAPLPKDWEAQVRGSSALELAAWSELPAASRVRLLEPLLASPDMATQITALATLQLVPGPEALAVWKRLESSGTLTYQGAKTQILVGLARSGDEASLKAIAPYESQLSPADRLMLAIGRAERGDPAGRAALFSMTSTVETDAIRAAEALATIGGEPRLAAAVRAFVRDGSPVMRERWLALAARLNLGNTPDVVRLLTSDDEGVRLAAAVAVAVSATRPAAPAGR